MSVGATANCSLSNFETQPFPRCFKSAMRNRKMHGSQFKFGYNDPFQRRVGLGGEKESKCLQIKT